MRFFALWLLAGVLEAPALLLLTGWSVPIPPAAGAAAHALAAALVFFAPPKERGWFSPTRHWGEPLALLTFFLPGLGWAASGWLVAARSSAPHDKEAYRFEDDTPEERNPLAGDSPDSFDVLPAVDALHSRDATLKRGAIEALSRIRTPEAVEWLLRARSDEDPEVRFYATSALTRLKRDFETAVQAAEREAYRRPRELEPQLALQRARYEYAASGLLDEAARNAVLLECRSRLTPRDPESARLLYHVELLLDPARALAVLERLKEHEPPDRWTRKRAETLFALGRYSEVKRLLAQADPGDEPRWRAAALWWSHD